MKVLITGGAGYIGSTTGKALIEGGHVPVVLDDLSVGPAAFVRNRTFYHGDVSDAALLDRVVNDHPDIDCVIHMAGRIVAPESVYEPYLYYRENVVKSLELFRLLDERGLHRVVFSSSASVYAAPTMGWEVGEDSSLGPRSPYARTKLQVEQILTDLCDATAMRAIILRYFNPIGSDPDLESGIYSESPSHVLGQLVLAASGQIPAFRLTGTEYPTPDGTGIRDYIHVWDLAQAHVRAAERFCDVVGDRRSTVVNLGTGHATTVRELVRVFERTTGRVVPVTEAGPRPGDTMGAMANVDRAHELLDWRAELSIGDGIRSTLDWLRRRDHVLCNQTRPWSTSTVRPGSSTSAPAP